MDTFVMTFEIMKPHGAASGNFERRCFVRNPSSRSGYCEAEGDAVIESPDFHYEIGRARRMSDRNARAQATVYGR